MKSEISVTVPSTAMNALANIRPEFPVIAPMTSRTTAAPNPEVQYLISLIPRPTSALIGLPEGFEFAGRHAEHCSGRGGTRGNSPALPA
jgi:hypothetical protein